MIPATADVSVVIPTYNRAALLAQTLASIERQTTPPARVIVVDDGSTDSTPEMLAGREVTVISNPAGGWGPSHARNMGLEHVSTEFVTFVDSDDLLTPTALELLRAALVRGRDAAFAYGCGLVALEDRGGWRPLGVIATTSDELRDPYPSIFVRNSVPASGALVRTEAIRAIGGYDVAVEWSEDHHLWLRLARDAPPAYVPELVCTYRRHTGNRYVPTNGGVQAEPILALARDDARLRPYLPDRVGVILCEAFADAVSTRRLSAWLLIIRALSRHPARPDRVLAQAIRHFRKRKATARLGERVWRERPDLRDWLEHV